MMSPTHKDCANFKNGVCMLTGVPVSPDEPACPNFTPKTVTTAPKMTATHRAQPYMPQYSYSPRRDGGYGFNRSSGRGGGMGRGRMGGGFRAGPGGHCVCPQCGYVAPHERGKPCFQQICPRCGSRMTRKL